MFGARREYCLIQLHCFVRLQCLNGKVLQPIMERHLLHITIIGINSYQKFPSSALNALSFGYCISKMLVNLSNCAVGKVVKQSFIMVSILFANYAMVSLVLQDWLYLAVCQLHYQVEWHLLRFANFPTISFLVLFLHI